MKCYYCEKENVKLFPYVIGDGISKDVCYYCAKLISLEDQIDGLRERLRNLKPITVEVAREIVNEQDKEIAKLKAVVEKLKSDLETSEQDRKTCADELRKINEALDKWPSSGCGETLSTVVARLIAENAALKAKLDAAPKCPPWARCENDIVYVTSPLGDAVIVSKAEYDALKAAAKRRKIECWEYAGYIRMHRSDGCGYTATRKKTEDNHAEWYEALGAIVAMNPAALNLDIVQLPGPPDGEKKA
jgi:outer membrane murein-binding lipoprotein Lpp